jgi:universal stress protein E
MPSPRVLFAIRNPLAPRQPGLAKAIQVARALGASLELFHALTDALIVDTAPYGECPADELRDRFERRVRESLARQCTTAEKHGVTANSSVAWDRPAHEAIVRRAEALNASLIIAECHKGIRTRPWLIHLTDWELLRISPVPVLLLKNGRPYHRPRIVAAVDPTRAHRKPRALDDKLLSGATKLADGLRGTVHLMHANYPSIVGMNVDAAVGKAATSWSTPGYEQLKDQERTAFEDFRSQVGVPRTRAHLVDGNPATQIPRLAGDLKAGIVVMGALSRSGLGRVLIGNTAERVLNALPCDALVINDSARRRAATDRA